MSKPQFEVMERPEELEDALNLRLYHPLSRRLATALATTSVTPNMVSVAGGLAVFWVAAIYFLQLGAIWTAFGLLLHMTWHVFDGADGDLARLTGQQSIFGEIVDGICDYIPHIALYLVLASLLEQQIGLIGWFLMIATGLARLVQASFYETQRRQYQHWVYGKNWLRQDAIRWQNPNGIFQIISRSYLRLSDFLSADGKRLDELLRNLPDAEAVELRRSVHSRFIPLMRFILPLSANYRTLVIGIAMVLGMPMLIVFFELVVLSFWFAISLVLAKSTIASIHRTA